MSENWEVVLRADLKKKDEEIDRLNRIIEKLKRKVETIFVQVREAEAIAQELMDK